MNTYNIITQKLNLIFEEASTLIYLKYLTFMSNFTVCILTKKKKKKGISYGIKNYARKFKIYKAILECIF
jgi:hypothetical protein